MSGQIQICLLARCQVRSATHRPTLEIDAEVAEGLDRSKVRTLIENAGTLGCIDKAVR